MKEHNKKNSYKFIYLFFILLITGCTKIQDQDKTAPFISPTTTLAAPTVGTNATPSELADFDTFLNEIFKSEIQADTLTLHFSLSDPAAYGIKMSEVTLGHINAESSKESIHKIENCLTTLKCYDYNSLTKEQKMNYDILSYNLNTSLALGSFPYFQVILGPASGVQAQLPIFFSEFGFYTKEDFDTYITLLNSVPEYFNEIVAFERQRSAAGYFMSDTIADEVIAQCNAFLAERENNLLISCFEENLNNFTKFSEEEKEKYRDANRKAIQNSVLPAYESLVKALQELKGTGTNKGGLSKYEGGADYYEIAVQGLTGSEKTIQEMKASINSTLEKSLRHMFDTQRRNPSIFDEISNLKFPCTDPMETLAYLKDASAENYPEPVNLTYQVKYVPEALREFLNPAMYFIPPLDRYENNTIYINIASEEGLDSIFPTLAHEGYPGHMLQNTYFLSQNPHPIRRILSSLGYDEGWAVYVEADSYRMAELNETMSEYLISNLIATFCLYAITDIGIHYDGWSLEDTIRFWKDYGANSVSAMSIYNSIVAEPGAYLPYCMGYLEFMELRTYAETYQGDAFSPKKFHEFILKSGSMPFPLLKKYLNIWLAEQ